MRAQTFIEILTEEIRKEVRSEFEAQLETQPQSRNTNHDQNTHELFQSELWLSLNLQPHAGGGPRKGTYKAQAVTAKTTSQAASSRKAADRPLQIETANAKAAKQTKAPQERVAHLQTIEQLMASEVFRREGCALQMTFTESEFKSAFRKLALKLHPDRHLGLTTEKQGELQARFAKFIECSEILSQALQEASGVCGNGSYAA